MANTRIKDISTTTSTTNSDDYIAIDGATAGTRKITASTLGGVFDENITTTQQIGAGTATPSSTASRYLTVGDASGQSDILINSANANFGQLIFGDADAEFRGAVSYSNSHDELQFYTAGTKAVTIDPVQRVGIVNNSPGNYFSNANALVVGTGEDAHQGITIATNSDGGGHLYFMDGVAAAPGRISYYHTGNNMLFYANDSERIRLTSDGCLGVGLSTVPSLHKLMVQPTDGVNFSISNNGSALRLNAVNNDATANVAAEFTASSYNFIGGAVKFTSEIQVFNDTTDIGAIGNQSGALGVLGTGTRDVTIGSDSYSDALFIEGTSGLVTVKNGLDLTANLNLTSASSPTIQLTDTTQTTSLKVYAQDSNAFVGTTSNHPLAFGINGSEVARFTTGGSLAINRTAAGAKIDLADAANSNLLLLRDISDQSITHNFWVDAGGNSRTILYADGQAEKIAFDTAGDSHISGGNFGIGLSTPQELVHLYAASGGANSRVLSRSYFGGQHSDHALVLGYCAKADTAGNSQMVVTETSGTGATGNPAAIRMKTGSIEFHTANAGTSGVAFNSQRAVIDSSGRLGVNQSSPGSYSTAADDLVVGDGSGDRGITVVAGTGGSSFILFADGTGSGATRGRLQYNHNVDQLYLGASGNTNWKIVGATGNLERVSTGAGIDFGSGASTTLDAYEEGSFTGTFRDATSGGNASSTTFPGVYTRIGDVVYFRVGCGNINTSGMTAGNVIYLHGLPFQASGSKSGPVNAVQVDTVTTGDYLTVAANAGTSYCDFRKNTSGAGDAQLLVSDLTSGTSDMTVSGWYYA